MPYRSAHILQRRIPDGVERLIRRCSRIFVYLHCWCVEVVMVIHGDWDIVVVGGVNWDFLVRGSHLPRPGETVSGDEFQEAPGGKGANQAIAGARLGARVAMVARVGKDGRGEAAVAKLADEGVNVDHVVYDPVLKTGVALIMVDWQGEKGILTAPGANGWLAAADVKN